MDGPVEGKILVTGAQGFLGWHLRLRLLEQGAGHVIAIGRDEWDSLDNLVGGVDTVFHLAGINRDSDDVVESGNRELKLAFGADAPKTVIFANTIHAGADTPYGRGKTAAADHLRQWMEETGGRFADVRLPNLFGEHGRPFYNSFVATFVELLVSGKTPDIQGPGATKFVPVRGTAAARAAPSPRLRRRPSSRQLKSRPQRQ